MEIGRKLGKKSVNQETIQLESQQDSSNFIQLDD